MTRLCTSDDVNQFIDTVGIWTGTQVLAKIDYVEEGIYDECGGVIKNTYSTINSDYPEYYFGQRVVEKIDRVLYGVEGSQVALSSTYYTAYPTQGLIVLSTTAINAHSSTSWGVGNIEIEYAPRLYSKYCAAMTAQALLEKTTVISGNTASKSLDVINKRVEMIKKQIMDDIGPVVSNNNLSYNENGYGVNKKLILQDHLKNKDLIK